MAFKAQAIVIFEKYLLEWESNPQQMKSGYDYEATYIAMMQKS